MSIVPLEELTETEKIDKIIKLHKEIEEKDIIIEALRIKIAFYENKKKKECEVKVKEEPSSLKDYILPVLDFKFKMVISTEVKRGMYILLKEIPCKIIDVKRAIGSKYPNPKMQIVGISLLSGKKCDEIINKLTYYISFEIIEGNIKIIEYKRNLNGDEFKCRHENGTNEIISIDYNVLDKYDLSDLERDLDDPIKNVIGRFITVPIKVEGKDKEFTSKRVFSGYTLS